MPPSRRDPEIVLLGRLHGVPVPVNKGPCRLGRKLAEEKRAPGSLSLDDEALLMR